MNRSLLRITVLGLALATLAALPAAAQVIPAGGDRWRTPADGATNFTFPAGDVESLCGRPASFNWNRQVVLAGVPVSGADWDTEVRRLKDADFGPVDVVSVPIQVTQLAFKSVAPQDTPCGKVGWLVKLAGRQPQTKMLIRRTDDHGGTFQATISVRVAFNGTLTDGTFLGTLFYTLDLPDPGGTPWTFGGPTGWQPGIDEDDNCIEVLRKKLTTLPASHAYFIEDLIAQGRCEREN